MRHRAAFPGLLAGLLVGALIPAAAPAAVASPKHVTTPGATTSAVTARIAPPVVTIGEPSGLVAEVSPVRSGRLVTLQTDDGTGWVAVDSATTTADGRAYFPLATDAYGTQTLRVVAAPQRAHARAVSKAVTLKVYSASSCSPSPAPVDPLATPEARCLAARLDRWHAAGLMGVGQQLNVSNQSYLDPLTLLEPQRVSVVGFDLEELALGETYQFANPPLQNLLRLAQEGAVLTASWHANNPHTTSTASDRRWHDLAALLDPLTPEYAAFWADFDQKLDLFRRLQTGDGGLYPPAAVVFRPFHEANGGWFWWGKPTASVYRKVWARMQARAAGAGVHNILWAYSFSPRPGKWIMPPEQLVPARVDVGGIDSYDPEIGRGQGLDRLDLSSYGDVAPKISRMSITEAGPHGSVAGYWDPAVITETVIAQKLRPLWAMLWFDDGDGKKQISSLKAGPAWLRSCANGFCSLR